MNSNAEQHLAVAKDYVAKGETFYRRAAEEIVAAQTADSTLSLREIGEWFDRSPDWVSGLVRWVTSAEDTRSPWSHDTPRRTTAAAKKVLRDATPEQVAEIVADLAPATQRKIAAAVDTESAKRQKAREQEAQQKEREHLGDDTVDDLELREDLQSTEYLLITARGNLRGFVKHVGEIGVDTTPEAWRESCLDWINDLEGHLGMAKALLVGDNVDWQQFEDLLAKEH